MRKLFSFPFFLLFFCLSLGADGVLPKDSLYQIQTSWSQFEGKPIRLSAFLGKPVIMTMVYLNCTHSCPMIIAKLKKMEKQIKAKGFEEYQFVLVSLDFERDRPEKLKKYMKEKNLSSDHWVFLTGKNDEEVREMALVLEINYKKLDDGDYSHSNVLALLDHQGRVIGKIDRLSADDSFLLRALEKHFKK